MDMFSYGYVIYHSAREQTEYRSIPTNKFKIMKVCNWKWCNLEMAITCMQTLMSVQQERTTVLPRRPASISWVDFAACHLSVHPNTGVQQRSEYLTLLL